MTFEDLAEAEELVFVNAMEQWARSYRETARWRATRLTESNTATPSLSENALNEVHQRIESAFQPRLLPMPMPDAIHARIQSELAS